MFDESLSFNKLRREIPGSPNVSTLHRWRLRGLLCRKTGQRVRLNARQVGGRYYVRRSDLEDFLRLLNGEGAKQVLTDPAAAAVAAEELNRMGA